MPPKKQVVKAFRLNLILRTDNNVPGPTLLLGEDMARMVDQNEATLFH